MPTSTKFSTTLILLLGDLIALTAFVYVGQRDHDLVSEANPLLGVLITAVFFALPWVISGGWLGAFASPVALPFKSFGSRTLNAWLVTTLLGLILRSYYLGRAVVPTSFIVAALVFGGLFLFAWRVLFWITWKIRARWLGPAEGRHAS